MTTTTPALTAFDDRVKISDLLVAELDLSYDDAWGEAASWQAADFDFDGVELWVEAGGYDPELCGELADAGVCADGAAHLVDGKTVAYLVSSGALTVAAAVELLGVLA